jgi:hypothetical protein
MRTNPRCPTPFANVGNNTCVARCPYDKKFINRNSPEGYKCVYWPDEQHVVPLVPVGAIPFEGWTLDELKRANANAAQPFTTEQSRFQQELAKVYANIDKQQKINDAFKDLQTAENARDQSPEAYQLARTAYYMLVKGPSWVEEERARVASSVVEPEVQRYRTAVSDADARTRDQQKTLDVVNGIKDKVLSLKDDFKYSVGTLSDQVEKVKMQVNMENRTREREKDNTWTWVDTILNILLIAVLLYATYTIGKRYFFPRPFVPTTTIRVPAYTGQSF